MSSAALDVFERMLEPLGETLSRESAQAILDLPHPLFAATQANLAAREDEQGLSQEEQAMYDALLHALDMLTALQPRRGRWWTATSSDG